MTARPVIIGNFHIEQRERTVAIRLVTDDNGYAIFGYAELPALIKHLKGLSPAKADPQADDLDDLI